MRFEVGEARAGVVEGLGEGVEACHLERRKGGAECMWEREVRKEGRKMGRSVCMCVVSETFGWWFGLLCLRNSDLLSFLKILVELLHDKR